MFEADIQAIHNFLTVLTPEAWLLCAVDNIPTLLIDHAHCERKAASTALSFLSKYPEKTALIELMSPLAREELLHFEKVYAILKERHIPFTALQPSRYGKTLHAAVEKTNYLRRLTHELIIAAIIEARSCERFHALLPYLRDESLKRFYQSLVKAEARHFKDYLSLAVHYCPTSFEAELSHFLSIEKTLIEQDDHVFRFHGGIPLLSKLA